MSDTDARRGSFMTANKVIRLCAPVILIWIVSAAALFQTQSQKVPTAKDVKAYQEAMAWFKKGEAMIGTPKENSDEQAEFFRKALQIKPDFVEAHYDLGLIYTSQKKLTEAVQEFEAVAKFNPEFEGPGSASIYQLLASNYRDLGRDADAIAALRNGVKRQPKNLTMWKALAYLQLHEKDDAAALPTLLAIADLDPKDTDARMNLGVVYQRLNRLDDAVRAYRAALELNPDDFNTHYNLALVLMHQQKNAEAAAELAVADKLSPGNGEVLELLGDAYSLQDEQAKAADAYQAAVAKAPDRAVLYSKLAFALARLKRTQEAVAALEKSLNLNPNSVDAYYMLGDLYSALEKYDESIAAYKNALMLDPRKKEVHYNLGTLYAEIKRFGDARAELKAAVELDPGYAAAWSNLAVVCEKLDLAQEAIQANEKVAALGKARATNYFRLGILYAKSNQPEPAIAAFAKAIELEPDKYRQLLREELKNVHSVLDCVRYRDDFIRLLGKAPVQGGDRPGGTVQNCCPGESAIAHGREFSALDLS